MLVEKDNNNLCTFTMEDATGQGNSMPVYGASKGAGEDIGPDDKPALKPRIISRVS